MPNNAVTPSGIRAILDPNGLVSKLLVPLIGAFGGAAIAFYFQPSLLYWTEPWSVGLKRVAVNLKLANCVEPISTNGEMSECFISVEPFVPEVTAKHRLVTSVFFGDDAKRIRHTMVEYAGDPWKGQSSSSICEGEFAPDTGQARCEMMLEKDRKYWIKAWHGTDDKGNRIFASLAYSHTFRSRATPAPDK